MNRRSFLWGTSSLTLASMLSACEQNYDLKIALLQGSIPIQLMTTLQKESAKLGIVKFDPQSTIEDIYDLLLNWQGKNKVNDHKSNFELPRFSNDNFIAKPDDLVSLGNYWLNSAISEKLIESLQVNQLQNWQKLPPSFQNIALQDNNNIWGAPYRWGCTMIAYRQDKFEKLGWLPQDWSDLWRSDLNRQFSLLNQPREVIGLILKKLGYSYNTEDLNPISELKSELIALHKQVKFYGNTNYLQPLILGDSWLAVGWSNDILPVVKSYSNISAVIPSSGTALTADMWVKPIHKDNNSLQTQRIYDFIDFCWADQSAKQISLFTSGLSPLTVSFTNNSKLSQMSSDIFSKSEFIKPLPKFALEQYQNMWKQIN